MHRAHRASCHLLCPVFREARSRWHAEAVGTCDGEARLRRRPAFYSVRHRRLLGLKQAREQSRRAIESAKRNETLEAAAGSAVNEALREAEFGNFKEARGVAASAIQLSQGGRYVRGAAGLSLAIAEDVAEAQKIADALAKEFPGTPSSMSTGCPRFAP